MHVQQNAIVTSPLSVEYAFETIIGNTINNSFSFTTTSFVRQNASLDSDVPGSDAHADE